MGQHLRIPSLLDKGAMAYKQQASAVWRCNPSRVKGQMSVSLHPRAISTVLSEHPILPSKLEGILNLQF